jgi:hypothetical protein
MPWLLLLLLLCWRQSVCGVVVAEGARAMAVFIDYMDAFPSL